MTLSLEEIEKLEKLCASKKGDWYLLEAPWLGDELTAILEGSPDPHGGKFLFNAEAATDCVSDEESDANIAYSWAVSKLTVQGINALPTLLSMAKRSIELEKQVQKQDSWIQDTYKLCEKALGDETPLDVYSAVARILTEKSTLKSENEKLRKGLEVLALNEGMTSSFRVRNNNEGKELMARLDFARNLLKGVE